MKKLNENIKNFRNFRNITQADLAKRINKSKNVVSNWERGENSPDVDTVEMICQILQVTPNQIFGWEPCPEYERYMHRVKRITEEIETLEKRRRILERELKEMEGSDE